MTPLVGPRARATDRIAVQATTVWVQTVLAFAFPVSAFATSAFDPATSDATWTSESPLVTDAEGLPLWDRVERHRDLDATLFVTEDVAPGRAWSDDSPLSPHAATLFGAAEPPSDTFLLHFAPGWALAAAETPVLLVPGAGTTASGVFGPLARSLAARGRAVFAISFPHPDGDAFQQAEQVADAIARIQALLGVSRVDVVAHSKGGIAVSIALGHREGADWGPAGSRGARYADRGTPLNSIRRFVAVAVPFGGLDTAFRWTATHLVTATGADPLSPSPWWTYYPFGSAVPGVQTDLRALDFWPAAGDPFPGQAQLLAPWDEVFPLPGGRAELGVFALQQDWLTTYVGGVGFVSSGPGLDSARLAGGEVIDRLTYAPLPAGLELSVLAGGNPLLSVDPLALPNDVLGEGMPDWLGQTRSAYRALLDGPLAGDYPDLVVTDEEIDALSRGDMMLGEISGPSDGLVFIESATAVLPLLEEGAELVEVDVADLSHLDLLFASPPIGAALEAEGLADPDRAHLVALGQRYIAADTHGWIAAQLERGEGAGDDDDSAGDDDDSAGDDDDATAGDDDDSADAPIPVPPFTDCGCVSSLGASPDGGWWSLVATLLGLGHAKRRRRAA